MFTGIDGPDAQTGPFVHWTSNRPGGRSSQFDGEVTSDIETVGALAPGAHIAVYFAPNTERGFAEAVARAVYDARTAPSVISVSWGRNETHWTRRTLRQFEEVLQDAAIMGVTVCCSSGDHGAFADPFDRTPGVCFPGSSPWAVACGGTSLAAQKRRRRQEHAWANSFGASGTGESRLCPRPPWQPRGPGNGRPGRLVPDVSVNGDPASGYRVFVFGRWHVGAGTSASAPVWAALVARINQLAGRPIGLFTPSLYRECARLLKHGALRPVPVSPHEPAPTRAGWRRHTGLGIPHGKRLAAALGAAKRRSARPPH